MDIPMSAPGYSLRRPVKTALHQAILDCRIHQVRLLVEKHGGDVDAQDMFGRTPLMLACLLDNEDYGYRMAKLFLRSDCYINMTDNMNRTALHYACMKGREKMIRKLLREDSLDISLQDNDGNTALMHASLSGNPRIVEILIDMVIRFGLSIDERNAMGFTAFLLACKYGHYVSAYYLLAKGCSQPDIRDIECNMTPKEWVKKSLKENSLHHSFTSRRSKTMPEISLGPLAFARENTMYPEHEDRGQCRHIGTAPNQGGRSLGSALRLPGLFKAMGTEDEKIEGVISGRDACDVLLRSIDESIKNRKKFRKPGKETLNVSRLPTTTNSRVTSTMSRSTLSSSKLRKIITDEGRKSKAVTPDLLMLFKLYSDKYVGRPDSHITESRESLPHVRFDTATETVIESPMKMPDINLRVSISSPTGHDMSAVV